MGHCEGTSDKMPRRGFEPPLPYGNYALNVARLPVPPPGPVLVVSGQWSVISLDQERQSLFLTTDSLATNNCPSGRYKTRTCDLSDVNAAL